MMKEIDEGGLLLWLKSKAGFSYRYAGQCRTGAAFCFLVNSYFPRLISPDRVVISPHAEPECRSNYALLLNALNKLGFSGTIHFDEVIKGNNKACLNALHELQILLEGASPSPQPPLHHQGQGPVAPKSTTAFEPIIEPRSPYKKCEAVEVIPDAGSNQIFHRSASPQQAVLAASNVVALDHGLLSHDVVQEVYRSFDFVTGIGHERDRTQHRLSPVDSLGPSEGSEDALEPFRTMQPVSGERLVEQQGATALSFCIRARPFSIPSRGHAEQCRGGRPVASPGPRWTLDGNAIKAAKVRGTTSQEVTFQHIFEPRATTDEVYSTCCRGAVLDCWMGSNVLLATYGARNSGKTYTISGGPTHVGVIECVARDLFALVAQSKRTGCVCKVLVSYFEVYNERVLDLLQSVGTEKDLRRLPQLLLLEDGPDPTACEEVVQREVHSVEGLLRLHRKGTRYRHTSRSNCQWPESRSHAILQLTISKADLVDASGLTLTASQLCILDTAGSQPTAPSMGPEREAIDGGFDASEVRPHQRGHLVEVVEELSIHKSLSAFTRTIQALGERQHAGGRHVHVPYHESKLTRVLAPLLCGASIVVIIGTVDLEDFTGTLATLAFGQAAGQARGSKVPPGEYIVSDAQPGSVQSELKRLKAEVKRLRKFNDEHAKKNTQLEQEREAQAAALEEMEGKLRKEQQANQKSSALMEKRMQAQEDAHREQLAQMDDRLNEVQGALSAAEAHKTVQQELQAEVQELKRMLQEKDIAIERAHHTTEQNAKHIAELEQQLERQERVMKAGREGEHADPRMMRELQAANDKLLRIAEALAKERQQREAMQRMIEAQFKPSRWSNMFGKSRKVPQWQQHVRPIAPYRRQVAEEFEIGQLMSEIVEDEEPPHEMPPSAQPPPRAPKRRPERERRGNLGPLLEV
eukprot:GGOE01056488.1.p1 GENE.GGOE01056488.1~~GGOE01056488.1.p1  ORF type:complete len:934 (-),score=161.60 GGOE01056488.1:462-3221(-)